MGFDAGYCSFVGSSSRGGTAIEAPHLEHRNFVPAWSSLALNRLPQMHCIAIAIADPKEKER